MGICLDVESRSGLSPMTVISSLKEGSRNKSNSYGVKRRQINLRSMSEPNMSKNGAAHLASGSSNPQKGPLLIQHQTSLPDPQKLADVPIIFVLGGPGTGKLTHCDKLAENDLNLVHINMGNTFLNIANEYGNNNPNKVPAYKALEMTINQLLNVEQVNGIIVTGYPRNMRDVVEYMAKIKRVDGVILLDWSDRSLQRQVELGTKEKKIDPQVARFELENYKSNIIAVADFFDQQGYLHLVAGEREFSEVFDDLTEEVSGILAYPTGSLALDSEEPPADGAQQTSAEVHSTDQEEPRRKSVDSVDQMIEEELVASADEPEIVPTEENTYQRPRKSESAQFRKWSHVRNKITPE